MLMNYRQLVEEILTIHTTREAQVEALTEGMERAEGNGWRIALKHVGEKIRELGA
jgi:hypothetical protein